IPLTVAIIFVFSSLGYDPFVAWAQEAMPSSGVSMQAANGTGFGMHNPCFPNGFHGHRMHSGQHGNQTNYMMHQFGQNATWMRNGTHNFGQYGNHTGFKMSPCQSQKPTSTNNGNINSTITQTSNTNQSALNPIPNWVRNNAKWWSQGQMGDSDFIQGVQYLIQQGIMKIPQTQINQTSSHAIPAWVKTNAKWWSQGQISDDDFIKGIQYLVSSGIVKV
ncbi:MAG: hypothetical protein KGI25_09360, partial [Thaumarchaeota archaeon]|nr:hypothetical protein [Nitrososphaerota archaeon]